MIDWEKPPNEGLSQRDLGHLKYLQKLTLQPLDQWEGFYRSPSEGMNFGLRFQIAFAGYALYALARRTPAYQTPYAEALKALTERMLAAPVWTYWFGAAVRAEKPASPIAPSGRALEVLHSRLGLSHTISPDPCQQGNVQYSGHLASLLGFYQLLSGDSRYDETGFDLFATGPSQSYRYHYTYSSLIERLQAQMQENHFGGVCCEPGRAYAACNNHACIANVLYDHLYATNKAEVNRQWGAWVENRMLTGGARGDGPLPAPNGLLSVAYMPDLHLALPVSFNLTDAWGLAFMAAWQPDLVKQIYPRLRRRLKKGPGQTLYLSSVSINQKVEISSVALNTAFAAVLAREMGDTPTYTGLRNWADNTLSPVEDAPGRYYAGAVPAPYVTALFALAEALPESGGLQAWLNWRPDLTAPRLLRISPEVDVTQAEWSDGHLRIGLKGQPGTPIKLEVGHLSHLKSVSLTGITEVKDQSMPDRDIDKDVEINHFSAREYLLLEPEAHINLTGDKEFGYTG